MSKEVILPSGAKLEITVSPFSLAKALYQAVVEEAKGLKLDPSAEIDANFWKDLFCTGVASKRIEAALNECMKRVTYNGVKISDDTWEPIDAREDYLAACFEVARENIQPFTKSLYAKFSDALHMLKGSLA